MNRSWQVASRLAALAVGLVALLSCAPPPPPRPGLEQPAVAPKTSVPERPLPDAGAASVSPDPFVELDEAALAAVASGKLPGCVVVAGRRDEILFRRAYGARALLPERAPMTVDTVFDVASLTKPVATAASLMLLVERGRVRLDDPAARWVPELAKLPRFTVRHLLLHTSGLPATTALPHYESRAKLHAHVAGLTKLHAPGERFVYSDLGYLILEEIVRRVSGEDLAAFSQREVFAPLGMAETGFLPSAALRARAAPTEQREGRWMIGEVHDPRAHALGGVAGHAGVFSTADDLARFAQAWLRDDGPLAVPSRARFLARASTPKGARALGWDVETMVPHKSPLWSAEAFGHGGFTGTAMWIDPARDLFLVFLSNRVHPDGRGEVHPLVAELGTRLVRAASAQPGIDVLADAGFEALAGAKVALLTNTGARAKDGRTTLDVLRSATGTTLVRVLTPEHGLGAEREGAIGDGTWQGIPVTSLYGARSAPDDASLEGVDTVVVDLQDVGVRFYTYASTTKLVLRAAAARGLRVVVLDRPNPLGGVKVEGPLLESVGSFVNHHRLPVRHGMTLGELARLFVAEEGLRVRLDVVRARGWRRQDEWERTGLAWASPSPNLRSVTAVRLYPAIGMLEGTNLSVGRGTEAPFELVGAPWLDGEALAREANALGLPGVAFEPASFTPTSSVHANKACRGVRVRVTDRGLFAPVRTGAGLALALRKVGTRGGTRLWSDEGLAPLFGHRATLDALRAGRAWGDIARAWDDDVAAFEARRRPFLLY